MPNTPKFAFPYPAATDPVASGAANIQALAEAVEAALTNGLDFAKLTASVALPASGTEATAATILTGTVRTYTAGRRIIEFWCPGFTVPSAVDVRLVVIRNTATPVPLGNVQASAGTTNFGATANRFSWLDDAAPAGAYNYIVKAWTSSGTGGTLLAGAGGAAGGWAPAWMRVT